MSQPDEPDEISRELDAIFAEFFGPPTELDLRGVDPATFALGLSYGFDSWQHARVVANNRRNVAIAAHHWAEHHPSPEFLSHAVGTDESAARHRELLDRAHPGCAACEEQLERLTGSDLDRVDPDAPPDDLDLAWLLFQPMDLVRRLESETETARPLHIRGRAEDQSITAEPYGGREWRITVRDPRARHATVWIGWTGQQITQHTAIFENDLAEIEAEAPEEGPGRNGCGSGSPARRTRRSRGPGRTRIAHWPAAVAYDLTGLGPDRISALYIYVEFKVEIRRGREGRHGHRVTVECEKPDGGRVGPTDAQPITSSVTRLMPAMSAERRIDLGEELGQCMFPPRVLAAFTETLRGLDADVGIRVRLLCVDEEMARWPWELARVAVPAQARPRYLFRDERFSLVRAVIDHRPVDQPKERRKLVILTVDATKVLDGQELEPDFPEQLSQAAPLRRFDLPHPTRRTIDELIDQVADGEDPLDIFHFTGHGRPPRDGQAGALVLYRDQDTGSEHYRGDELAKQLHRAGTSLAFVNACYTDQAAPGDGPASRSR